MPPSPQADFPSLLTIPVPLLRIVLSHPLITPKDLVRFQSASRSLRSRVYEAGVWERTFSARFGRAAVLASMLVDCGVDVEDSFAAPDGLKGDEEWQGAVVGRWKRMERQWADKRHEEGAEVESPAMEEESAAGDDDVGQKGADEALESDSGDENDTESSESEASEAEESEVDDEPDGIAVAVAREGDEADDENACLDSANEQSQKLSEDDIVNEDGGPTQELGSGATAVASFDPSTAMSACFALLQEFDESGRKNLGLLADAANGALAVVEHSPSLVQPYHILSFVAFITNNLTHATRITALGRSLDPSFEPLADLQKEIADVQQKTGLDTGSGEGSSEQVPLLVSTPGSSRPTLSPPFTRLLHDLHARYDLDRDGVLNHSELSTLVQAANGTKPQPRQMEGLVQAFGVPGAGVSDAGSGGKKANGRDKGKSSRAKKAGLDVVGLAEFFLVQTLEDADETRRDLEKLGYSPKTLEAISTV
ncbi:hypothetical protein M427DRAFT_34162 [Gonapodya prolifera JEL478]|uniref:EF-hand domain-containing protein n=1 Tax=Gonapodya prolifera (strain JEL478) TaxID=1344416 RepID=A0A139A9G4_GONPJ|nr:hypothetical protein M427DRAFT_34162 [Gonapodya prolifera JEL478]|eukprot:KXS13308.1 hypothetical protein M427DRAFT_34162 [Gonapodya prolifera JEL478]